MYTGMGGLQAVVDENRNYRQPGKEEPTPFSFSFHVRDPPVMKIKIPQQQTQDSPPSPAPATGLHFERTNLL